MSANCEGKDYFIFNTLKIIQNENIDQENTRETLLFNMDDRVIIFNANVGSVLAAI